MAGIHLYAEILVNIRTVSLVADLNSVNSLASTAELSANGESLTLRHEGEHATIYLPAKIPGRGSASLDLPASPSKKISLRLEADGDISKLVTITEDPENAVPWMAQDMTRASEIICRSCSEPFIISGRLPLWKDLPSDNWAEMMDFWHCHKPDVPHHETSEHEAITHKGYAASNRLTARSGEGLVDVSSFLFSQDDIQSIKVVPSNDDSVPSNMLQCQQCEKFIGILDDTAQGRRILKSSVAVIPGPGTTPMTFPTEQWIAAQLLSVIDNQAARRFLIRDGYDGVKSILLWVFTPDVWFCSSTSSESQYEHPTRGMKVFWRSIRGEELLTVEHAAAVEEIRFPVSIRQILHERLNANQKLLPSGARKFQEWDVSILRRFTRLDFR